MENNSNILTGQALALARMLSLPPLGQIGRLKFGPFLRTGLELLGADAISIGFWISPHELRRFRARAGESAGEIHEDVLDPGRREGAMCLALREGRTILVGSPASDPGYSPDIEGYPGHESTACVFVGLRLRDEPPCVLALYRFGGEPFTETDRHTCEQLSPLFAAALDNLRRFGRAEELSITDGLTGVYNYRYLRSALDKEIARAARFRERFSIIMLDVDHLKEYNDVHGHLQGSEVLRRVAQVMMGELRGVDVVAKYGGDEFVIILPRTIREGAGIVAERIRAAVEAHEFPGEEEGMRITSSMGIAQYPDDGETARDLLESADNALYVAKRSGRNRVTPVASSSTSE